MGYYINPPTMEKERWLAQNKVDAWHEPPEEFRDADNVTVCLVNNGLFTAAGICVDQRELEAFARPQDQRPKLWVRVPIAAVYEIHPEFQGAIAELESHDDQ
jgi:hypothetical protein